MKRLSISLALIFFASFALGNVLKNYCDQNGGTLSEQWTCPTSQESRTGLFCTLKNDQGKELVTNGCTGAKGEYGDIFFPACVIHDFCYHHEPNTSQKSKEFCDRQLLRDFRKICENYPEEEIQFEGVSASTGITKERCEGTAVLFYLAVKLGGKKSWSCSKEDALYPSTFMELHQRKIK